MNPESFVPGADLLAERVWLRSLAGHLVREPADADDLAQEALLAGLERPPGAHAPLRPWLRTVVSNAARKLWRSEERRGERERSAARPEHVPSEVELVERLDAEQAVGAAVRALDEPYRGTILLRYVEGLTAAEIAARHGTTPEAVRKRLERAREVLRARLTESFGGEESSRRALVALWLPASGAGTPPFTSTAPASGSTILARAFVACGAVAATSLVVWTLASRGTPSTDEGAPVAQSAALAPSSAPETLHGALPVGASSQRAPVAAAAATSEPPAIESAAAVPIGITAFGVVVDPAGRPVPDAALWLIVDGALPGGAPRGRTDDAGRFEVAGLTLGDELGASADGWAPSSFQPVRGRPGERWPVRVELERAGAEVAGAVVDEAGEPLAGARVRIGDEEAQVVFLADSREGRTPPPLDCTADAEGRFRRAPVPLGEQLVQARAPGFAPAALMIDVAEGGLDDLRVALAPEARIVGLVRRADGSPAPGAQVRLADVEGFAARETRADEEGRFALAELPSGEVRLVAAAKNGGRAEATLALVRGGTTEWNAELHPTPRIHGRLVDAQGRALARWNVSLWPAGEDEQLAHVATDAEGRFSFAELEPVEHDLVVKGPDAWMEPVWHVERDVKPSDAPLVIRIVDRSATTATVVGRVLTPEGEPALGVMLEGWHVEEESHSWFGITPDAKSGRFEIARLAPGHVFLGVRSAFWPYLDLGELEVEAGKTLDLGDLQLEPAGFIEGRFLRLTADELAQVEIRIFDDEHESFGPVRLNGDHWRSPPLGRGELALWVDLDFRESVRRELEVHAGEVRLLNLALRPAGLIRVFVVAAPGVEPGIVRCLVFDALEGRRRWSWIGILSPEGEQLRISVVPGDYELVVDRSKGAPVKATFTVHGFAEEPDALRVELR